MTINFDESIRALWYVQIDSHKDYLCALSELPSGEIQLTYRFAYRNSLKAVDVKDVKNWYGGKLAHNTLAECIDQIRFVTSILANKCGAAERGQAYEIVRGNMTLPEFVRKFIDWPCSHIVAAYQFENRH